MPDLPDDTVRETGALGDSDAVQRGDVVRYIDAANIEFVAQVQDKGPVALDATICLVVVTWDALGFPTARIESDIPSARTVGGPPYWTT